MKVEFNYQFKEYSKQKLKEDIRGKFTLYRLSGINIIITDLTHRGVKGKFYPWIKTILINSKDNLTDKLLTLAHELMHLYEPELSLNKEELLHLRRMLIRKLNKNSVKDRMINEYFKIPAEITAWSFEFGVKLVLHLLLIDYRKAIEELEEYINRVENKTTKEILSKIHKHLKRRRYYERLYKLVRELDLTKEV